jgi:hypothetical protein
MRVQGPLYLGFSRQAPIACLVPTAPRPPLESGP